MATNEPVPARQQRVDSPDQQLGPSEQGPQEQGPAEQGSPEQQVTSPDQHRPGPVRAARVGAIVTVALLLMMAFCAHGGSQENRVGLVFLLLVAAVIVGVLVADWLLRRNGLRD